MKKVALAAALSLAATSAFAGSMADPIVEMSPVVIEGDTSTSSGGSAALILLALLAVAAVAAD